MGRNKLLGGLTSSPRQKTKEEVVINFFHCQSNEDPVTAICFDKVKLLYKKHNIDPRSEQAELQLILELASSHYGEDFYDKAKDFRNRGNPCHNWHDGQLLWLYFEIEARRQLYRKPLRDTIKEFLTFISIANANEKKAYFPDIEPRKLTKLETLHSYYKSSQALVKRMKKLDIISDEIIAEIIPQFARKYKQCVEG